MKPLGAPDSLGLWDAALGLPEQVEEAVDAAVHSVPALVLPRRETVEQVVVLGMGGSGLAGDVLAAAAAPYLPVPVTVVKSYSIPAYVSQTTLVFALSFSGATEETLEAALEAVRVGADVVAVTTGGELAAFAKEEGLATFFVPARLPLPRAALGAMAVPPMVALEAIGLFPGARRWLGLSIEQLRRRRDQLLLAGNVAEEVARRIGQTIPVVESSRSVGVTAAMRWKTQINENAKRPAFWGAQPDAGHHEVVGWGHAPERTRDLLSLLHLRHDGEHPQVARRFGLVAELVGSAFADVIEVHAEGEGDLAQLFDLVLVGDLVSLHLAAVEGVDPGPAPVLDVLKARLRGG